MRTEDAEAHDHLETSTQLLPPSVVMAIGLPLPTASHRRNPATTDFADDAALRGSQCQVGYRSNHESVKEKSFTAVACYPKGAIARPKHTLDKGK